MNMPAARSTTRTAGSALDALDRRLVQATALPASARRYVTVLHGEGNLRRRPFVHRLFGIEQGLNELDHDREHARNVAAGAVLGFGPKTLSSASSARNSVAADPVAAAGYVTAVQFNQDAPDRGANAEKQRRWRQRRARRNTAGRRRGRATAGRRGRVRRYQKSRRASCAQARAPTTTRPAVADRLRAPRAFTSSPFRCSRSARLPHSANVRRRTFAPLGLLLPVQDAACTDPRCRFLSSSRSATRLVFCFFRTRSNARRAQRLIITDHRVRYRRRGRDFGTGIHLSEALKWS